MDDLLGMRHEALLCHFSRKCIGKLLSTDHVRRRSAGDLFYKGSLFPYLHSIGL